MTTTPFTSFAFKATGGSANRTTPDRLSEIKNVKDFGALGDGTQDDGPYIQAAVNWTTGPNRGTIFFPTGFYTINAPITFNYDPSPGNPGLSIRFAGTGSSTFLNGTSFSGGTGYTLDRHLGSPNNTAQVIIENMSIGSGGEGSIRVGSCSSVAIRNVSGGGITTEDSAGNSSQNIFIQACKIGSPGLVMGGSGVIQSCDWINCDIAARLYGKGWAIYGGRIEECNTSYLIGLDSGVAATFTGSIAHTTYATFTGTISGNNLTVSGVSGTIAIGQTVYGSGVTACVITSGSGTSWVVDGGTQTVGPVSMFTQIPNDGTGVLTVTAVSSGTIKPLQAVSDGGVNIPGAIFIVSQLTGSTGGTGTYALSNPTVTVSSQTITTIGNDAGASGFVLQGGSMEGLVNGIMLAGTCSGFYIGSIGALGHVNSGPTNSIATQYGMIVGPNVSNGVFQGTGIIGDLTKVAACKVYTAAARTNVLFLSSTFDKHTGGGGTGFDWDLPTNAYTASWLNCNVSPTWTYAQLPTGGNVLEGDQFTITDSTTSTWGANVTTGGGSTRVLVRWNGSNWTVVGK